MGREARGQALLARGDTIAAAREFARAYATPNWQGSDAQKSIVARLGSAVDSTKWAAFNADAAAKNKQCVRAATVRDSLERRSR